MLAHEPCVMQAGKYQRCWEQRCRPADPSATRIFSIPKGLQGSSPMPSKRLRIIFLKQPPVGSKTETRHTVVQTYLEAT